MKKRIFGEFSKQKCEKHLEWKIMIVIFIHRAIDMDGMTETAAIMSTSGSTGPSKGKKADEFAKNHIHFHAVHSLPCRFPHFQEFV